MHSKQKTMEHLRLRIIFGICLFIGLFVAPFWMSALVALAGLIIIPYYWEALIFLACADLLYGGGTSQAIRYGYPTAVAGLFLAIEIVRGYVRENSDLR